MLLHLQVIDCVHPTLRPTFSQHLPDPPNITQDKMSLKKIIRDMGGLRLSAGRLLDSEADAMLVVSRMTQMHPTRSPHDFLTKELVHDKLLELMETCHSVRELMLESNRMERLMWERVQMNTSWAHTIPIRIIRKLALELAQAAKKNTMGDHTQRNSRGEPLPWCELAVASLRFATDIFEYEQDAGLWSQDPTYRSNFAELRAPAMLPNGKPSLRRDGNPVTIPVFPVRNLGKGYGLRFGKTGVWEETEEPPAWFSRLRRV